MPRVRQHVALTLVALTLPLALFAAWMVGGDPSYSIFFDLIVYNLPFVIGAVLAWRHARSGAHRDRRAWQLIAVGMLSYGGGNALFDHQANGGHLPWWSPDILYLALPLCLYAAIVLLVRARIGAWQPSMALDGLIMATGGAALLFGLVYAPLFSASDSMAQTIVYSSYPLADLVLLAMACTATALLRQGMGHGWMVLNASFIVFAAADTMYMYDALDGSYGDGGWLDISWMIAGSLVGLAATMRWSSRGVSAAGMQATMFWPLVMSAIVLAYLLYGVFAGLNTIAHLLGLVCLAMAVGRVMLTARESRHLGLALSESRTDNVTGLGNRRAFDEQLTEAVARRQPFALLMMDLDGFKQVNDGFGHEIGDKVLREVAKRIELVTPESTTASRIGGDEFALLVRESDMDKVQALAEQLNDVVRYPYRFEVLMGLDQDEMAEPAGKQTTLIDEQNTISQLDYVDVNATVGASIGCSLYPRDGAELELVRFADDAMYRAKGSGGGIIVHEPMGGYIVDYQATQFEMLQQLREAISGNSDTNHLVVHYQPIVPTDDSELTVIEALVRWQRNGELVPPNAFIPLAEQGGLMQKMTETVLTQSLRELALQRDGGHNLQVSVNLAVSSLLDPTLVDVVREALADYDLPASALKLEITESMIISDPRTAQRTVDDLRKLGIRVMVDDYGTGYSSIAQLQTLDVDGLKIDRSLVENMTHDPRMQVIVRSTIEMAKALNLRVVAEGVETQEQLTMLQEMGCDYIQGFFISRPMGSEQLSTWLGDQVIDERSAA